jgi:hypothetical protein
MPCPWTRKLHGIPPLLWRFGALTLRWETGIPEKIPAPEAKDFSVKINPDKGCQDMCGILSPTYK